ncbi:preprotein translocase subunit YajC [Rhizomicrobium electricum]|jgi:preprotein translocase subunit YajC|uniref:Sec translocon accessory complex subunit YajC n=1 Tax=Rhizomicrobium electricum TaxID=480070 RepID=A0ABP3P9Y6_9PROT|nr:preprotein translocase subunit YajC [Rhizomicrobium electricum]NIJ48167.1 preprotein translocase subunit YajC [Rhizomicrobium electricum]
MQEFLASPFPMLIAVAAIFYFLVWRPQAQQQKKLRAAVEGIRRGDTVVLNSGIVGKIAKAPAKEDTELSVEIAEGVTVKVLRAAVGEVRAKNQPVEAKADK